MYFSQSKHFQWPKKTFQKKKNSSELKPHDSTAVYSFTFWEDI